MTDFAKLFLFRSHNFNALSERSKQPKSKVGIKTLQNPEVSLNFGLKGQKWVWVVIAAFTTIVVVISLASLVATTLIATIASVASATASATEPKAVQIVKTMVYCMGEPMVGTHLLSFLVVDFL